MAAILDNARKGSPEAMRTLYDQNKDQIMFLCQALLLDENAACNAVSHVFKAMWELVVAGQVISEQDFRDTVTRKAVNHCKAQMAKRNARAFRVPVNRNFINTPYDPGKMSFSGEPWEVVLKNLPPLHRFLYVLHGAWGYDDMGLAKLFNTSAETVRLALQAEEANISRILALAPDREGVSLTAEDFHQALLARREAAAIPRTVTVTVQMGIDNICQPFLDRKKKRRTRNAILAAVLVVVVGLIVGLSVAAGGGTDQADPSASPSESAQVSETPAATDSTDADTTDADTTDTDGSSTDADTTGTDGSDTDTDGTSTDGSGTDADTTDTDSATESDTTGDSGDGLVYE